MGPKKMSDDNDDFESIVNGPSEEGPPKIDVRSLWDAVKGAYPHLYDGILLRGVIILDRVDKNGDRELRWLSPPDTLPWENLGMLQQVLDDLRAENTFMVGAAIQAALEEGDEDEQ